MRFETVLKVLKILQEHDGLTGKQLSEIRGINWRPCYEHLRYLQRLGLVALLVDRVYKQYVITPKGKALVALFSNETEWKSDPTQIASFEEMFKEIKNRKRGGSAW